MSYKHHCHFISLTTKRNPKPISSHPQFLSLLIPQQTLICFLYLDLSIASIFLK